MSSTSPSAAERVAVAPALLERHGAALRTYLAQQPGAEAKRVEAITKEVLREIQAQTNLEEDPAVWLFTQGRRRLTGAGQRGDVMLAQADEAVEADEATEDGRVAVHRAFERLTSKQQEALRLKFQFGFNLEEFAQITGLSPGGAAGLLHHAMDRIVQATAAVQPNGGERLRDPRITAYAFEEMNAAEMKAFVESMPDAKALLSGTEAIRQAGRQLRQILESGAPLPKRRRRRKGGAGWRRGLAGAVVVALAVVVWLAVGRRGGSGEPLEADRSRSDADESMPVSAQGPEMGAGQGGGQGHGVVAQVAHGRALRPGEAEWERKAFGQGTGQGAGVTGGASAQWDGGGGGAAGTDSGAGGQRSAGSATGPLGVDQAAGARGERGEGDAASSIGRPEEADEAEGVSHFGELERERGDAGSGAGAVARVEASAGGRAPAAESAKPSAAKVEPDVEQAVRAEAQRTPGPGIGGLKQRLAQKQWPKPDEVRVGELLRQVPPERPRPVAAVASEPLAAKVEMTSSPWAAGKQVVRVSVRAKPAPPPVRRPVNLVLAIDVSESMSGANRLPLVQEGMRLLAERMRPDDRVAVVSYAAQAIEVLPSQPLGESARELRSSLNGLRAAGRTNGYEGLQLAYDAARRARVADGLNVVVLCTDGNFNLGETDERVLADLAAREAKEGIGLSVFGFGRSDRNDLRLEMLAQQGGGRSCYVNTREEAERLLAGQIDGLLVPVAVDVELKAEFDEERLAGVRELHGEAAGVVAELLPGRSVSALYEIAGQGDASEQAVVLGGVQVDYRNPVTAAAGRLTQPLAVRSQNWSDTEESFHHAIAMAELGRILQGEAATAGPALERLESWVRAQLPDDAGGYRQEMLELVSAARSAAKAGDGLRLDTGARAPRLQDTAGH